MAMINVLLGGLLAVAGVYLTMRLAPMESKPLDA